MLLLRTEQLSCSATADVKKDWERDYDKLLGPLIEKNVPCYLLYRLDAKIPLGHGWLLISWTPDTASIRQKMVYASTKATLKTEFGSAYITEELHATTLEETTLEGYKKHKREFAAPAPLTTREEEIQELRKTEVRTEISTDTRHQTLGGLSCPLSDATLAAVQDLLRGNYDYLQFRIALEEERIHVSHAAKVQLADLPKQVPNDHARYHLYLFKHTHEGDYLESFVFIYSMPGYACSVRERMMYSSCKAPFLEQLAALGVDIIKKVSEAPQSNRVPLSNLFALQLEIESGTELTEEYLQDELHPKKILHRPAFAKPKGPPNRGAKRMTRPTNEGEV